MRLLILGQYYTPEPLPKLSELATAVTKRGHQVSVITGFPNYPTGKLYPGYKLKLIQRETIDGIPVVRTYEYPYHGKKALGRLVNYGSFMVTALLGVLFSPPCDLLYVRIPPPNLGITAWLMALIWRVPVVYDVQDIWPDSVVFSGMMRKESLSVRIMSRLEKFVYRRAQHLLVTTDGAKENLIAKGITPEKITVLPNWIDEHIFTEADPAERQAIRTCYGWENRFVILFAGNIGVVQGLDTVIQACKALPAASDVLMVFVGDGSDKARLQKMARDEHLSHRVQFIEQQPFSRMPAFMGAADALLVSLQRSEISNLVVPNKTFAYLAAAKPILAVLGGETPRLIEQIGAGLAVEPENIPALIESIQKLESMSPEERALIGERGRQYLNTHLSFDALISRYETLLTGIQ